MAGRLESEELASGATNTTQSQEHPREPNARADVVDDSNVKVVVAAEDELTLDASWLFKVNGQVFGPVSSKILLERLYGGDIDENTPIATEDGVFLPLGQVAGFHLHLPKAQEHRAALAEVQVKERVARRHHLRNWILFILVLILLGGGTGVTVLNKIRNERQLAAERETAERERRIREEMIETLMARLTIEPPLVALDEDVYDDKSTPEKRRARRTKSKPDRSAPALPPTVALTNDEIMEGVAQAFGPIKRCIAEQIQRDAESIGDRIVLSFSVTNAGRIENFAIDDRTLNKSPLSGCLGRHLAQLQFRKYLGEVRNVQYPITIGGRR